ncbi:DUF3313 domain-containing protein [Ancylobacter lacus]|uniref:DUF3313 domain-containing protein n=1 Tax=Ancylobacter lacus TaxID=2579970 RepID=UPI001BCF2BB9|nr:DUF3313 domain-containing protein [Ancylobacter lacus]MBS7540096.1 DUF3313 domain-containing protein [Ancylobacter lacus]
MPSPVRRLLILWLGLPLAACASPEPLAYAGLASSSYLSPNINDSTGRMPFRYSSAVDWTHYRNVIVDPVAIYSGADAQFGDLDAADRQALASDMQTAFTRSLATRFTVTNRPGPDTLRVRITLTGAARTAPVLGTLSRFDVAGGVVNGVQSLRDREGTLTGSVSYAVEIFDSSDKRLLGAYVAKQYPKPYDLPSGVGPLTAARTGIAKGAAELLAQFD